MPMPKGSTATKSLSHFSRVSTRGTEIEGIDRAGIVEIEGKIIGCAEGAAEGAEVEDVHARVAIDIAEEAVEVEGVIIAADAVAIAVEWSAGAGNAQQVNVMLGAEHSPQCARYLLENGAVLRPAM